MAWDLIIQWVFSKFVYLPLFDSLFIVHTLWFKLIYMHCQVHESDSHESDAHDKFYFRGKKTSKVAGFGNIKHKVHKKILMRRNFTLEECKRNVKI